MVASRVGAFLAGVALGATAFAVVSATLPVLGLLCTETHEGCSPLVEGPMTPGLAALISFFVAFSVVSGLLLGRRSGRRNRP